MGVVNWEDLDEIEESTRALSLQETMNALTGMLAEDDTAEARSTEDRGRRQELLIILAARYMAGTETLRRVPSGTSDVHFIILVYRPKGLDDPDGIRRPFALVARDRQSLAARGIERHFTRRDRRGSRGAPRLVSVGKDLGVLA